MRILLLGKNGQVGWELRRALAPLGELTALDYPEIDLANPVATRRLVRQVRPQVIVNAAAYTAVDRAESEVELARSVNTTAPGILAEAAVELGAALLHYSTDYVFDGEKGSDYTEQDRPKPLNQYGLSKLLGDQAIQQAGGAYLILRTSWIYSLRGDSFVTKLLTWAGQGRSLRIVTDQVGCPTWCRMLAECTAQLLALGGKDPAGWMRERRGVYHLAGSGRASRFEWANAVMSGRPRVVEVLPALSAEFPTPARRPFHTALDCTLFFDTFGLRLPDWKIALSLALEGSH
jgi:dTDP-4-dehydrorhamnose reductase